MPEGIANFQFNASTGPKIFMTSPDGNITKELYLNNDGTLSIDGSLFKINGTNSISFSFTAGTTPYISKNGTSYTTMAYFIFPGTNAVGTPTAMNIVSHLSNASKSYNVRIIRSDTGGVVAESSSFNNTSAQIKNLGTLSNLPTTETIFEIQGKTVSGGDCRISLLNIKF